jgi:hypothetical protein
MQVSNVQEHVSHAVISPKETISFGISDSPEFFQILSSSLYTNQKLAVVREVLCNAWDAHIVSGRTDRPVQVTLNSQQLVIQDFGPGIPQELIGEIYGTYGGSTKKADGNQTGGFGLGCKAPFAYTDHFEVQSSCEGFRTIYAVSRSSAERNGKPGITPIASFPCAETGLKVTIPILVKDYSAFAEHVTKVVSDGEIMATLNGAPLDTLPYAKAQHNWIIVSNSPLANNRKIHVRYGNVLYPIPDNPAYEGVFARTCRLLSKMGSYNTIYTLILLAPPHSLAVTPSRESLSLQEHTLKTLKKLLEDFEGSYKDTLDRDLLEIRKKQIDAIAEEGKFELLFSDDTTFGRRLSSEGISPIVNFTEIATQYFRENYPEVGEFFRQDMAYRLETLIKYGQGKRGQLFQLRHIILTHRDKHGTNKYLKPHEWYKKSVLAPLMRDLYNNPAMEHKRLHVFLDFYRHGGATLIPAVDYNAPVYSKYTNILRNIVVLTTTKTDINSRALRVGEHLRLLSLDGVYVYLAPPRKTQLQGLRDFFTSRGFTLLDLTVPQPWDPPKAPPRPKKDPNIPKPVGYPALTGAKSTSTDHDLAYCFLPGSDRVEQPECFIESDFKKKHESLFRLEGTTHRSSKIIVKLYGHCCAVVRAPKDIQALKDAGIPTLKEYVEANLAKELTASPTFTAYWPESLELALGTLFSHRGGDLLPAKLIHNQSFREAVGLTVSLTEREQQLLQLLWDPNILRTDVRSAVVAELTKIPRSPVIESIRKNYIKHTPIFACLDFDRICVQLMQSNTSSQEYQDRLKLLLKTTLIG